MKRKLLSLALLTVMPVVNLIVSPVCSTGSVAATLADQVPAPGVVEGQPRALAETDAGRPLQSPDKGRLSVVDYRQDSSLGTTGAIQLEIASASFAGAREQLLNLLTEAYLLKEQAAQLSRRSIVSRQKTGGNAREYLHKLRNYRQRAENVKTQLAQGINRSAQLRQEITTAFNRFAAAYDQTTHRLEQNEQTQALTSRFKEGEEKTLAAWRDLQTAREIFELLELKVDVSGDFVALIAEEESREKRRLLDSPEASSGPSRTLTELAAAHDRIASAILLLDAIDEGVDSENTAPAPATPTIVATAAITPQPAASPVTPPAPPIAPQTEPNLTTTQLAPPALATERATTSAPHVEAVTPPADIARKSAVPDAATTRQIEDFLHNWAKKWSTKDIAAYLDCYAPSFVPSGGMSRNAWQAERRKRLGTAKFIEVKLDKLRIIAQEGGKWRVELEQRYSSDSFRDHVKKVLHLQKNGAKLRIVREESLGTPKELHG